jgi:hypothetical protein
MSVPTDVVSSEQKEAATNQFTNARHEQRVLQTVELNDRIDSSI